MFWTCRSMRTLGRVLSLQIEASHRAQTLLDAVRHFHLPPADGDARHYDASLKSKYASLFDRRLCAIPLNGILRSTSSLSLPPQENTQLLNRFSLQVTLRRVPTSSRPVVLSATPSRRTAATRSAPTCTASLAASLVPPPATASPMPTRTRALSGTTRPCSSTLRTPRSTFPAPRWPLVASRRRRTAMTSTRKFTSI